MNEQRYYEVCECITDEKGKERCLLLPNPNHEKQKMRWLRFKTLEEAKGAIEKSIEGRKKQYFWFRDKDKNIVDKISFYDRYQLKYEITEIVMTEKKVYEENHIDTRKVKEHYQEETSL